MDNKKQMMKFVEGKWGELYKGIDLRSIMCISPHSPSTVAKAHLE